ncbi:hypothetical protein [Roseibium aestuarii]|uniref:Transmembrane protein n=1 Tax=Roseibium aestuarii TaxID=2600299 RepID=A0ABW4JW25_9HYPH|nr:hypothetical protein [Roseibium aestuarii]
MFLIWRGWGLLLPLGVCLGGILGLFLYALVEGSVPGDLAPAIVAVGCSLGAYGALRICQRTDKGRLVVDKKTGEEILMVRGDSIFFIPVRFWFYLVVLATVALFVMGLAKLVG